MRAILPVNRDELQGESFWWSTFLPLLGADFSKIRASQLHRQGLRCIRDVLIGNRFLSLVEAQQKFNLVDAERGAWEAATRDLLRMWGALLADPDPPPKAQEWVGWYVEEEDALPAAVFQAFAGQLISFGGLPEELVLPAWLPFYSVLPRSRCLKESSCSFRNSEVSSFGHGRCRRVRVVMVKRGP